MEFTGKTVEQAIELALAELKIERDQAEIKVLEEKNGLFKKAKVEVSKKMTENEKALDFVERLFEKMNVAAAVEMTETEEECRLNVSTTDTSIVIGKRGEALDAVQYLTCMYVNKDNEDFHRIVVDCENYREKRTDNLKKMAEKLAEKATETGRRVQLDPMNPYERRIIHAELQKNDQVTTESRGTDPNRFVVIYPKNRKFPPRSDRSFNRDRNVGSFRTGFNRDQREGQGGGRPFNRDGQSGDRPYNRESRGGFNRDKRDGSRPFNRDRRDSRPPKKEGFSFGTFLGNVNDNKDKDVSKDMPDEKE